MKVLHILPDDKFWRLVVSIFDRLDVLSEYVCVVDGCCNKLKQIDSDRIKIISKNESAELWLDNSIDVFIFHSVPYDYYDYILSVPADKKVIASFWGYDLYYSQSNCPPILQLDLYKQKTKNTLKKIDVEGRDLWMIIKRNIRNYVLYREKYKERERELKEQILKDITKQKCALNRVDFASTVLSVEFEMLLDYCLLKANRFPFVYTSLSLVGNLDYYNEDAESILVGNSGDPSNNHIDVISLLRDRGVCDNLYIPLSYGQADYINTLKDYLKSYNVKCVVEESFLPPQEYKKKLKNCKVAVFGHIRQQALGNIVLCMLQGSKVFLYKDSIAYKYFKSIGSIVFSIEEELTKEEIQKALTPDEIAINRKNLDCLSVDAVVPELNRFFVEMAAELQEKT